MKYVLPTLIKMTVVMTLVACAGQSSDPKKEYNLKGVPAHHNEEKPSKYIPDAQSVLIDGANETSFGNFIEGKQGELKIRIIPNIAQVEKPTFTFLNFPTSEEPNVVEVSANVYKLVWTPKAGTIAPGQTNRIFTFDLQVNANGQHDIINPVFSVSRTNFTPKIKGVDGLGIEGLKKVKVQEGESIEFTVDVQDQNFSGATRVMIFPSRGANTEAFAESAAFFVIQNHAKKVNPEEFSPGIFRFYYVMKVSSLPDRLDRKGKVDENADTIPLCIDIEAVSSGATSGTVQRCVEGHYAAQPPVVTFAKADKKVVAGQSNVIDLTVGTANSLSAVSIQALSIKDSQGKTKILSIDKDLHCEAADKKTSLSCSMTWTPSCTANASTTSSILQIKSVSNLNQKSKTSTTEESFEVDNSVCEAQAKAKIEADKKAADERVAAELKAKEEKAAAAQAAADKKAADAKALAEKKAAAAAAAKAKATEQKNKPKTSSTAEQKS